MSIESQYNLAVAETKEVVLAAKKLSIIFVIVYLAVYYCVDLIYPVMERLVPLWTKVDDGQSNMS